MKYLKKYEDITKQPNFKKGEMVYYPDLDEICKIIDVNVTSEIFDDEDTNYLDFDDTYVYRVEDSNEEHFNFDWIDEFELKKLTPEIIEKHKLKRDTKKYNL